MFSSFKKKQDPCCDTQGTECENHELNGEGLEPESAEGLLSESELLEGQLTTCRTELDGAKDQLLRLGADFQNYKRRMELDQSRWILMGNADLLSALLPIVDDFDRAMQEADKEQGNADLAQWISGFALIHKGLHEFLKKNKVELIDTKQPFNPELHEALMQVDAPDYASGEIVQVFQQGFMLHGKVLRAAKVSVAK